MSTPKPARKLRVLAAISDENEPGEGGTPRTPSKGKRTLKVGGGSTPARHGRRLLGDLGEGGTPRSNSGTPRSTHRGVSSPSRRKRGLRSPKAASRSTSPAGSVAGSEDGSVADDQHGHHHHHHRRHGHGKSPSPARKPRGTIVVQRFRSAAKMMGIAARLNAVSHVPQALIQKEEEERAAKLAQEEDAARQAAAESGQLDVGAMARLRAKAKRLADKARMTRAQRAVLTEDCRRRIRAGLVEGVCVWYKGRLAAKAADARMWSRYGYFLFREGRYPEASAKLKVAIKLGFKTGEVFMTLARSLILEWRTTLVPALPMAAAAAIQLAGKPCWRLQLSPEYWVFLAFVHEASGSFAGALAVRAEMIQKFPGLPETRKEIFRAALLMKYLKDYTQAKDYLDFILKAPPAPLGEEEVSFEIAHILELQGKENQAAVLYAEIFRIWHDDGRTGEITSWTDWYTGKLPWEQSMERAREMDCWHAVLLLSKEVLRRSTTTRQDKEFYTSVAQGYMRVGAVEEGINALSQALALNHFDHEVRATLAAWDPEGWGEALAGEVRAFTAVQAAARGRRCRKMYNEWKETEVKRALKQYQKDMYDPQVRHFLGVFQWHLYRPLFMYQEEQARVIQRNVRRYAARNGEWKKTMSAVNKRIRAAEHAYNLNRYDPTTRENVLAVAPEKYQRLFAHEEWAAIHVARMLKGHVVRVRTGYKKRGKGVKKVLQKAIRSVGLLGRMRTTQQQEQLKSSAAAKIIQRCYRNIRAYLRVLEAAEEAREDLRQLREFRRRLREVKEKLAIRTIQRFALFVNRWYDRHFASIRIQSQVRRMAAVKKLRRLQALHQMGLLVRLQARIRGTLTRGKLRRRLREGASSWSSNVLLSLRIQRAAEGGEGEEDRIGGDMLSGGVDDLDRGENDVLVNNTEWNVSTTARKLHSVESILAHGSSVGGQDLEELSTSIRANNRSLKVFGLSNCPNVTVGGVTSVVDALRVTGHPIEQFCLEKNNVGDEGALAVCWLLGDYFFGRFAKLSMLSLQHEGLTDRSGMELARTVDLSHSLKTLRLNGNLFTAKTALVLASNIPKCRSLEELDISNNDINTDGLVAVIQAVRQRPLVVRLRIANNYGSFALARPLLRLVRGNKEMEEVVVTGNAVLGNLQGRINGVIDDHRAAAAAVAAREAKAKPEKGHIRSQRHGHMRCFHVAADSGFSTTTPGLREVNTGATLAHISSAPGVFASPAGAERPPDFGSATKRPLPAPLDLPIGLPVPTPGMKPGQRPTALSPLASARSGGTASPLVSSRSGFSSRPGTASFSLTGKTSRPQSSSSTATTFSRPGTASFSLSRDRPQSSTSTATTFSRPGTASFSLSRGRPQSSASTTTTFSRPGTASFSQPRRASVDSERSDERPGTASASLRRRLPSATPSRRSRPGTAAATATPSRRSRPGTAEMGAGGQRDPTRMQRDRPPSAYARYSGYQKRGGSAQRLGAFRKAAAANAPVDLRPEELFASKGRSNKPKRSQSASGRRPFTAVDALGLSLEPETEPMEASVADDLVLGGFGAPKRRKPRPKSSASGRLPQFRTAVQ